MASWLAMSPRTLIFDFDGTIADTFTPVVAILNALASEFGYRQAEPGELPTLTQLEPRELAKRMGLPFHKLPLLAVRVRKEMAKNMPNVRPCKGIVPALTELRQRGVGIGILTSNSRENVSAFLAHNPDLTFDFISTGSGLFSKQKRLRRLLDKRGFALAHTSYVGDETRDIEAAKSLGMRMIAVGWGFSAAQLLSAKRPDHLIMDPAELLALV